MRRDDCNGNSVVADEIVLCSSDTSGECAEFLFAEFPMAGEFFFAINNSLDVELSSLRYIDVCVNGIPCKALDDSGAQLSIIIMSHP